MTTEDAKMIFNNISELALFSDMFCDSLQEALGAVVEGGTGEDSVGALFRQTVCLWDVFCPFVLTFLLESSPRWNVHTSTT